MRDNGFGFFLLALQVPCTVLLFWDVIVAKPLQPPDMAIALELCAKRGGVHGGRRWEHGKMLRIKCNDGTALEARKPKQ